MSRLYVIVGDDVQEKGAVVDALIEGVEPDLRAFNVERLRGGDTTVATVLDAARTLPFAAPRRMVVVFDAERLLEPKRDSEAAAASVEQLGEYLEGPSEFTTLVLVAEALDGRRTIVKQLLARATVVDCSGPGVRDGQDWARQRVREAQKEIDRAALSLLVKNAGADMPQLRADVDRVLSFVGDRQRITAEDVELTVGGAAAGDPWAVTNALGDGRTDEALRQLALQIEGGAEPVMVLGQIGYYVRTKLPGPRVPAAVEALLRTDREMKSTSAKKQHQLMLLERLVVEIGRGGSGGPGPRARS